MWAGLSPLMRLLIVALGGITGYKTIQAFTKKKIFISFAIEDKDLRDLLVGQSLNSSTPFEFVDMSVSEPWKSSWKTQCRERIKHCHGMIVLVSNNTHHASGVSWEVKCAKEENIRILAMRCRKNEKNFKAPLFLQGVYIYKWSWKNIERFVAQLK